MGDQFLDLGRGEPDRHHDRQDRLDGERDSDVPATQRNTLRCSTSIWPPRARKPENGQDSSEAVGGHARDSSSVRAMSAICRANPGERIGESSTRLTMARSACVCSRPTHTSRRQTGYQGRRARPSCTRSRRWPRRTPCELPPRWRRSRSERRDFWCRVESVTQTPFRSGKSVLRL